MVKIRLRRVGATKQPSYRIVVAESRSPRDGRFIEMVGFYNPRTEPPTVEVKEDRVLYWLTQGAQPTGAVASILNRLGTMDRLTRFKRGESLDVLLKEAAAASQPHIEKESTAGAHAQPVAETGMQAKEVAGADIDLNTEATSDVVNAEGLV